jgi:hypothetical protein
MGIEYIGLSPAPITGERMSRLFHLVPRMKNVHLRTSSSIGYFSPRHSVVARSSTASCLVHSDAARARLR